MSRMKRIQNGGMRSVGDASLFVVAVVVSTTETEKQVQFSDFGRWTFAAEDLMSTMSFRIIAADHTGITVANLERSLDFWQNVLGFELSHRAHHTGDLASEVTGVPGTEISLAVLKGYGHKIELLEYLAPQHRQRADLRPCDVGSVHVALTVDNLDAVLNAIAASAWHAAGQSETLQSGAKTGTRVVYVRDL